MSEWYDNQNQSNSGIRQLLQEQIEKSNPRRELTTEEARRLAKLAGIADKLKRGESEVVILHHPILLVAK